MVNLGKRDKVKGTSREKRKGEREILLKFWEKENEFKFDIGYVYILL